MKSYKLLSALALLSVVALGAGSDEKDPAKLAPDIYKVALDNDHVRVLDIHMAPGARSPMHSHPGYLVYALSDGKARFTAPDGKTRDVDLKAGQTYWRDAESHAVENVGNSEIHVLNIELKNLPAVAEGERGAQPAAASMKNHDHVSVVPDKVQWQPVPPELPPGAQMAVLSGDPKAQGSFVIRLKSNGGYKIPPHFHSADENITVISGALYLGEGDAFDPAKAQELPAGSYSSMPAGMHHFGFTKADTIVQISGNGPFDITYINPADNPNPGGRNPAPR